MYVWFPPDQMYIMSVRSRYTCCTFGCLPIKCTVARYKICICSVQSVNSRSNVLYHHTNTVYVLYIRLPTDQMYSITIQTQHMFCTFGYLPIKCTVSPYKHSIRSVHSVTSRSNVQYHHTNTVYVLYIQLPPDQMYGITIHTQYTYCTYGYIPNKCTVLP